MKEHWVIVEESEKICQRLYTMQTDKETEQDRTIGQRLQNSVGFQLGKTRIQFSISGLPNYCSKDSSIWNGSLWDVFLPIKFLCFRSTCWVFITQDALLMVLASDARYSFSSQTIHCSLPLAPDRCQKFTLTAWDTKEWLPTICFLELWD